MVDIAKQLKYFARQPRARAKCSKSSQKYVLWGCFSYIKSRGKRNAENKRETIAQYEQAYLADSTMENAENVMNANPWKPNTLVGPEQWISYEAMLTWSMLEEEELNDFAMFMYCKLNQPDLDHARDLFD